MKNLSLTDRHGVPSEMAEAIDLDVTPVMNMFIILIPFLVSMAVFSQISIINVSLPPNAGSGVVSQAAKPRLKMTIVVAPAYLAVTCGETLLDSIAVKAEGYDLVSLAKSLATHRVNVDIPDEAVVAVLDAVKFKHVIAVMDCCREAGYRKIGLSNATSNPREGA